MRGIGSRARVVILVVAIAGGAALATAPAPASHCMTAVVFRSYYASQPAPVSGPSAPCQGGYITPGSNTFEVWLTRARNPESGGFFCYPDTPASIEFDDRVFHLSWNGCTASSSGIGYHYFYPVNIEGPGWPDTTVRGHVARVTVCPPPDRVCQSMTYRTVLD